jgi:hypothetical protein
VLWGGDKLIDGWIVFPILALALVCVWRMKPASANA